MKQKWQFIWNVVKPRLKDDQDLVSKNHFWEKKNYSETHKVHIKGKSCVAISLRWIRKQIFFLVYRFVFWRSCIFAWCKNVMKTSVASWSKNLEPNNLALYEGVMVMKYRSWVETHLIPNFAPYTQIKSLCHSAEHNLCYCW